MNAQAELLLGAVDYGEAGRRCWLWDSGKWQVGRAWSIDDEGRVNGMCRDYGDWGVPYPGRTPLETHGRWLPDEVAWSKPKEQYVK